MEKYRTKPTETEGIPAGIPYIVANEAAERFSFYGMRAILVVFMTKYLMDAQGNNAPMSDAEAKEYYHLFVSAVYFFPFLGAILSDGFFGKYRTILALSGVYCLGHLALALDETRLGLMVGLGLIALGSGGIKPCVSAHVGDQFGAKNKHLLERVFSWFYFSINLGAFTSSLLTPIWLDRYGPHVAFGIPGILMAIATLLFWMGRHRFIHVPAGGKRFFREATSPEGLKAVAGLVLIYAFVAFFWSLFEQTGSAWVLQARDMNQQFLGMTILPSQFQAANPLLILIGIPLFSYYVYPAIDRWFPLTPLRKISIGLFVTAASFASSAIIQLSIDAGSQPNIVWQIVPYIILTTGEIMVSITCLEFSYTQAPRTMKSIVMALYFLSITMGNLFTAFVNSFIQNPDGSSKLAGADYYWFFTAFMAVGAVCFVFVAMRYKVRDFVQGDEMPADPYLTEN